MAGLVSSCIPHPSIVLLLKETIKKEEAENYPTNTNRSIYLGSSTSRPPAMTGWRYATLLKHCLQAGNSKMREASGRSTLKPLLRVLAFFYLFFPSHL